MEKLIELLNEYEYDKRREKTLRGMTNGCLYYIQSVNSYLNLKIISKEYGFIKWLVENDKIDRLTFCTIETPSSKYEDFDLGPETPREDYTNILLIDLALQEKPIEFLISILR